MFTSYAQNFEDVILWRALKHVVDGFYIDIGAQDPRVDSVSRGFYEQGWHGVSIAPIQAYAGRLRADRPGERIIQAAVGTGGGEIAFFEFPCAGLGVADPEMAEAHKARGLRCIETKVPLLSLGQILREAGRREIHWLKVNVAEGQGDVFRSWGDCDVRPWIVVAESAAPPSRAPTHDLWEDELIARRYRFVYCDGVNRYYLSHAHPELERHFGPGPNVFDDYTLSEDAAPALGLRAALRALRMQVDALAAELDRERGAREIAVAGGAETERLLRETRASMSWRITAPLRVTLRAAQGGFALSKDMPALSKGMPAIATGVVAAKRRARGGLVVVTDYVRTRPVLKRVAVVALGVVSPLRERLRLALQREREERSAALVRTHSGFVLTVEPDDVAIWRNLIETRPSESKPS